MIYVLKNSQQIMKQIKSEQIKRKGEMKYERHGQEKMEKKGWKPYKEIVMELNSPGFYNSQGNLMVHTCIKYIIHTIYQ